MVPPWDFFNKVDQAVDVSYVQLGSWADVIEATMGPSQEHIQCQKHLQGVT